MYAKYFKVIWPVLVRVLGSFAQGWGLTGFGVWSTGAPG